MPEIRSNARIIYLSYLCDKCKTGYLESSGMVLTCNPPKYEHICSHCKEKTIIDIKYNSFYFEKV